MESSRAKCHLRTREPVKVEVAGENHGLTSRVLLCVIESFGQLQKLELFVSPALKVEVIRHDSMSAQLNFGNKRDASPKPLLKRFRAWQEPLRFPEVGLITESNYSRVLERPAR